MRHPHDIPSWKIAQILREQRLREDSTTHRDWAKAREKIVVFFFVLLLIAAFGVVNAL